MIQFLLENPPFPNAYVLSVNFNQDRLENYFGKVRMAGGRSNNPDIKQMLNISDSLRVQASIAIDPLRGNCRKRGKLFEATDEDLEEIINLPLPKRKKSTK